MEFCRRCPNSYISAIGSDTFHVRYVRVRTIVVVMRGEQMSLASRPTIWPCNQKGNLYLVEIRPVSDTVFRHQNTRYGLGMKLNNQYYCFRWCLNAGQAQIRLANLRETQETCPKAQHTEHRWKSAHIEPEQIFDLQQVFCASRSSEPHTKAEDIQCGDWHR
jgi:hypothetical protein